MKRGLPAQEYQDRVPGCKIYPKGAPYKDWCLEAQARQLAKSTTGGVCRGCGSLKIKGKVVLAEGKQCQE